MSAGTADASVIGNGQGEQDLGAFLRQQCGGLNEAFNLLDVECTGVLNQEQFVDGLRQLQYPGDGLAIFLQISQSASGHRTLQDSPADVSSLDVVKLCDFIGYFRAGVSVAGEISPPPPACNGPEDALNLPTEISAIVRSEVKRAMSEVAMSSMEGELRKAMDAASASAYGSWEAQARARFEAQMRSFATQFEKRMESTERANGGWESSPLAANGEEVAALIVAGKLEAKLADIEEELRGRVVVTEVAVKGLSTKGTDLRDELHKALDTQRAATEGVFGAQGAAMEEMQQKIVFNAKKLEVFIDRVMEGLETMMESLENTAEATVSIGGSYHIEMTSSVPDIRGGAQSHAGGEEPQPAADRRPQEGSSQREIEVVEMRNMVREARERQAKQAEQNFSEALRALHTNLLSMHSQEPGGGEHQSMAPSAITRTHTSPQLQRQPPSSTPDSKMRPTTPTRQPPGFASSDSSLVPSLRIPSSNQQPLQALSVSALPGLRAASVTMPNANQVSRMLTPLASPRVAQPSVERLLSSTTSVERRGSSPIRPVATCGRLVSAGSSKVDRSQSSNPVLQRCGSLAIERQQSGNAQVQTLQTSVGSLELRRDQSAQRGRMQSAQGNAIEQLRSLQKDQLQSLQMERLHSVSMEQLQQGNASRLAGSAAFNTLSQLTNAPSFNVLAPKVQMQPWFRPGEVTAMTRLPPRQENPSDKDEITR